MTNLAWLECPETRQIWTQTRQWLQGTPSAWHDLNQSIDQFLFSVFRKLHCTLFQSNACDEGVLRVDKHQIGLQVV